jgi:hypothetical protein
MAEFRYEPPYKIYSEYLKGRPFGRFISRHTDNIRSKIYLGEAGCELG